MFSYTKKGDLKGIAGFDTLYLASKLDLACLKAEIDKIDTDKLKALPPFLSKLTKKVVNDVVKNLCMINQLQRSMQLLLLELFSNAK